MHKNKRLQIGYYIKNIKLNLKYKIIYNLKII